MRPPSPVAIAIAVAVVASGAVAACWTEFRGPVSSPAAPVPACGPAPSLLGSGWTVPAGQYREIDQSTTNNSNPYGGPTPQSRISVWSDSSSTYYAYIMSQAQFGALGWTSNATGPSNSILKSPAQSYVWGSGPVTAANHTILVGNGEWFVVLYDPGSTPIIVDIVTGSCNAP